VSSGGTPRKRWLGPLAVAAALVTVSTVAARTTTKTVLVDQAGRAVATPGAAGTGPGLLPGDQIVGPGRGPSAGNAFQCAAGRNGGVTDVGVTAGTIKLGATVVESGIGRSFLADVRHGMIAVVNRVNATGGICGRRLELILKDDGWDPNRGFQFIQNLVEDTKVFALAVVPSSEGLRAADRYIEDKRIPVVGADGMLVHQYTNPYIWPVASATISAMHIMAKEAYGRGARQFGIVYETSYRFGIEGAYAFNAAVKRLVHEDIPGYANPLNTKRCLQRFCGIDASKPNYLSELQEFKSSCDEEPKCTYIVYLLEPDTAEKWMAQGGPTVFDVTDGGQLPGGIGAPQPLFNRTFGVNCGDRCHDMWVWTGYTPAIQPFTNTPDVAEYMNELRQTNSRADANNSFVEGGYLGMKLLVEALRTLGPNVTRTGLAEVLDRMTLNTGLSRPLRWSAGNHLANQCMMGFSIQSKPSFAGWRQETDFICDPWIGQDIVE
jgi:ABC-type branched-subunit amino acid transport system substrate-binding protein